MPHITHWQHPNFYAFFPANASFPAILGELLSAGLGVQGMLWVTSPACTEIEVRVLDWLARMVNLPKEFTSDSTGGGVIHGTASEAVLVSVVAARHKAVKLHGLAKDPAASSRMTVYCSSQTHSCVKKACMIAGIHLDHLRTLDVDPHTLSLTPKLVEDTIKADLAAGLVPIFMCATIGTTSTTASDPVDAIGAICAPASFCAIRLADFLCTGQANKMWLHVDAAYAGSALICPEYQHFLKGIERADSFCFNPHKWLRVNFDCSAYWVQDRGLLVESLSVMPEYLRNKQTEAGSVVDYRDWQVPLGRRFRALKLWFTLRTYGQRELQNFVRSVRPRTAGLGIFADRFLGSTFLWLRSLKHGSRQILGSRLCFPRSLRSFATVSRPRTSSTKNSSKN